MTFPVDYYSRNAGLVENDALQLKRALIVGLGSFGSQIAVELAKAAVGRFTLVDFDKLEPHNIVRHACFLNDVGRLKIDAVADLILGKNPTAEIVRLGIDITEFPDTFAAEVECADVVVVATDNNQSRFILSRLIMKYGKVGIFGRANTRAEGGDVFVQRPGGPCYGCLVGNRAFDDSAQEISSHAAGLRSGAIAAYTSPEDAAAVVQVGLSSDIAPITNLMVKLALVQLSRGTSGGIAALETELTYDYWMWANRRERRFKNWAAFPQAGAYPTILRWYGAKIGRDEGCPLCGEGEMVLET